MVITTSQEGSSQHPNQRATTHPQLRAKGNAASAQTPTEERRSKMVDMLRIKEESRGFKGKSLLRRQQSDTDMIINMPSHRPARKPHNRTDVIALIKMNHRHYTAINSSGGITRYENLMYDEDALCEVPPDLDTMCSSLNYNSDYANYTIDNSGEYENLDKVQQLTPRRIKTVQYTGFCVKSYQNPNPAQILAAFPDPRPRTVPISRSLSSFYQRSPNTRAQSSLAKRFDARCEARVDPRFISYGSSVPGITKLPSAIGVRSLTSPTKSPYSASFPINRPSVYQKTPRLTKSTKQAVSFKGREIIVSDSPVKNKIDPTISQSSMISATERAPMVITMKKAEEALDDGGVSSPTIFVVEDVDGIAKNIEFEETPDQTGTQTTKLQRQESEDIMANLKEHAEKRQKKFAQLLDEHKEIVQEIGRISSSDCIVTQTQRD